MDRIVPDVGVHPGVPFAEYERWDAVNASSLKWLQHSDRAYAFALANPRPDTDAMILGAALHTLLLEPQEWESRYAVWTGPRRAGAEWERFASENAGRTILRADDVAQVEAWLAAVAGDEQAATCAAAFRRRELSICWRDRPTGLLCKARIDADDGAAITDIKTTSKPTPWEFENDAVDRYYPGQLAFYVDGYAHAMAQAGHESRPRLAQVLAVFKGNSELPPDAWVQPMSDGVIEHGRSLYRFWLQRAASVDLSRGWQNCVGVARGERVDFVLPAWAERQLPDSISLDRDDDAALLA